MARDVMEVLAEWPQLVRTEYGALVRTSCIMPSGYLLSVSVQPVIDGWIVCGEGSAIWEAEAGGRSADDASTGLKSKLTKIGLKLENGKIYSGRVSSSELPYMVAYVATATLDAARWLRGRVKSQKSLTINEKLPRLIRRRFGDLLMPEPLTVAGSTENQYTFRNVLLLPDRRKLSLDPVSNQDSSIKSRVVANLDVARAQHDGLIQRIVYDDEDPWEQHDLALLTVGAPAIALSSVEGVIERMAA